MTFIDNRPKTTTFQKIVQWIKYNSKELLTSFYLVVIQMACWIFAAVILEYYKCDITEYTFLYILICTILSYIMVLIIISKPPKN